MINFTKDFTQALFDPDKINDLFRNELQQAINELLEAELTAFLGYDPYARNGWNTGNSRNGAYFRKVETQFGPIEIQVPRDRNGQCSISTRYLTTNSTLMSWKAWSSSEKPSLRRNFQLNSRLIHLLASRQ